MSRWPIAIVIGAVAGSVSGIATNLLDMPAWMAGGVGGIIGALAVTVILRGGGAGTAPK
jgi:hypothetical protein